MHVIKCTRKLAWQYTRLDYSYIIIRTQSTLRAKYIIQKCNAHGNYFSNIYYKKHLKNVGPIRHNERLTPIHQMSLAVLSRAACASMSTTTTTTTRDRGDCYGPMEWAQQPSTWFYMKVSSYVVMALACDRGGREFNSRPFQY